MSLSSPPLSSVVSQLSCRLATLCEISHAIGRGERTVIEYRDITLEFHPELALADEG